MKYRTFQFPIPNPECRIRDCLTSTSPVFCEEKEIKINSNEETTLIHSRFIGEKFYSVTRKIRNDGEFLSKSQSASFHMQEEGAIEDFKKQWENCWDVEEAEKSEEVETRGLEPKEAQKWEDFKNLWENECVASIHGQAAFYSGSMNEAKVAQSDKNGIVPKLKRFFRMK